VTDSNEHFDDPQLHREMRDLPLIKAPDSLIPGVISLIHERRRAWYRRPATTWPRLLQFALVALGLMAFAGITWGTIETIPILKAIDLQELFATPIAKITSLTGTLDTLLRVGTLVGRTAVGPALLALATFGSLFYLILFGAGTALWRSAVRIGD
jgi:hypothetical protein